MNRAGAVHWVRLHTRTWPAKQAGKCQQAVSDNRQGTTLLGPVAQMASLAAAPINPRPLRFKWLLHLVWTASGQRVGSTIKPQWSLSVPNFAPSLLFLSPTPHIVSAQPPLPLPDDYPLSTTRPYSCCCCYSSTIPYYHCSLLLLSILTDIYTTVSSHSKGLVHQAVFPSGVTVFPGFLQHPWSPTTSLNAVHRSITAVLVTEHQSHRSTRKLMPVILP
ncbi:hypothetical protein GGR51DRAFT_361919 [Nemania sp. FL0031]|nr:hypothetical protein GGR51DRAFT_361919 [Nemania sp. FL0031]